MSGPDLALIVEQLARVREAIINEGLDPEKFGLP